MEGARSGKAAVAPHPGHRPGTESRVLLEHITKRYGEGALAVSALADVSLEVDEGEFVVVLGPSGSGKTTLLNIIGALDTPTEGTAIVAGKRITDVSPRDLFRFRRDAVSFVFQSMNLFPGLTALENVQFALDICGHDAEPGRAASVLASVGLAERARHFPHQMSGGEQQRVAIARALASGNPVLLADEPTGELDFTTGVQILDLLQRQAVAGMTVIVVTHNREISRIADRVVELSSGRIVSDGAPAGGRAPVGDLHW